MPDHPSSTAQVTPDSHTLDDLELQRCGVDVLSDPNSPVIIAAHPSVSSAQIRDLEGVPVAEVTVAHGPVSGQARVSGVTHWLAPRSQRPFEHLHRPVSDVRAPTMTISTDSPRPPEELAAAVARLRREYHATAATPTAPLVVTVLVSASMERAGAAWQRSADLVRYVVDQARDLAARAEDPLGVQVVVLPIAADHPYAPARHRAAVAAYTRGGRSVDLSSGSGAVAGPVHDRHGAVLFFTGLSGSGKSTLARAVRNRVLEGSERVATLLDGDVVRHHLSAGLGFGTADRDTNIRRIGWVAARIAEHGGLAICSPIAPFAQTREAVRATVTEAGGRFVLIHVATPLAECERRDRKGLYARARAGEIPDFTGISSPYEEPADPDMRIDTTGLAVEPIVQRILAYGTDIGLWTLRGESADV